MTNLPLQEQPVAGDLVISVVLPVKNEAQNIAALVRELEVALAPLGPFEVIYVNDGSTDTTADVLLDLAQSRPWLRQIRHAQSAGQSAAVRTGVKAAQASIIGTLDGDGQNDPAYIPELYRRLVAGGPRMGLAAGQRVGRRDSRFKKVQSRIANAVRGYILRDGTRDSGCGLKVFRREAFLSLPYFDAIHRFLPALMIRDGYLVCHADVVDRPRMHGRSNYGFWKRARQGVVDLAGLWWLIKRRRPDPVAEEVFPDAH
ncbi:MAG: glycosyltransferase family 2 protein [Beijerinckiaceae bacterium]|nr:glycosyltransferase family 2 protein [Beijerinckiaceae bacterium]